MNEIRAYLYTISDDGAVNVHEGTYSPPRNHWGRQGRFCPDKGQWSFVSSEPGEVYYRKIWLRERDDERVKRIYLDYHRRKIEELERRIDLHRRTAVALLEEIENGNLSI